MDCTAIILTIGIIFAASFFSTVSGFGFALVAMPVLTLVMSVKAAVIFDVACRQTQVEAFHSCSPPVASTVSVSLIF